MVFRRAAAALIRAHDEDDGVKSGWTLGVNGRAAGLLCFDEVQVTDPFAALTLKGVAHC